MKRREEEGKDRKLKRKKLQRIKVCWVKGLRQPHLTPREQRLSRNKRNDEGYGIN